MENKRFWQSKTKIGALLVGLAAILTTAGAFLQGSVDAGTTVNSLITEVGVVLAVLGVRDWNIINK